MKLGRNLTEWQELMRSGHPDSLLAKVSTVRHILAPTDLSGESRKTIKYAMHLARRFQAKLTLLHVCQLPKPAGSGTNSPDEKLLEQKRNQAKLRLLSLHDIIRAQYANTEPCLRFGEPPREVILTARSLPVDLIIISEHDYAWLNHFRGRNEGKGIFHSIPCPVLIFQEYEREYVAPADECPHATAAEVAEVTSRSSEEVKAVAKASGDQSVPLSPAQKTRQRLTSLGQRREIGV